MSRISKFLGAAAIALTGTSTAQAEPADERSLPHLLAGLSSPGQQQSMLTDRGSFVTLGSDNQCRIALSQEAQRTFLTPTAACDCDETIGFPHRASISGGQFDSMRNSGSLVNALRAAAIIDGDTNQVVFIPRQGCEQAGRGGTTPSPNAGQDCAGCNGHSNGDNGAEGRDPPGGGPGNPAP